jgi:hypothetical protein
MIPRKRFLSPQKLQCKANSDLKLKNFVREKVIIGENPGGTT